MPLLIAAALFAGTAAASAAQTPDPATLARVDALAAMARGNVGLLKLIDQLTRDTIAGHPCAPHAEPSGRRLMKALNAQTARLIAQLTSSVSDNTSRMHRIASSIRNV